MGLELDYFDGQTPIDEDEKQGLLIPTISTRMELDEFEQQNIEDAIQWIHGRSFKPDQILTELFIKNLHKRMYGQVWSWAGSFRLSNKNLGVPYWQISVELKKLLDDTILWLTNDTFPPNEMAVRFKHRIVSIHCFPNGNGRHSRLMADIIIENIYKRPFFTWGSANLVTQGVARANYIKAVKAADTGDLEPLLAFARS